MKEDVGSVAVCVVARGMIAAENITLYTEEDDTALGIPYIPLLSFYVAQ